MNFVLTFKRYLRNLQKLRSKIGYISLLKSFQKSPLKPLRQTNHIEPALIAHWGNIFRKTWTIFFLSRTLGTGATFFAHLIFSLAHLFRTPTAAAAAPALKHVLQTFILAAVVVVAAVCSFCAVNCFGKGGWIVWWNNTLGLLQCMSAAATCHIGSLVVASAEG